jgi:hypothetical protein
LRKIGKAIPVGTYFNFNSLFTNHFVSELIAEDLGSVARGYIWTPKIPSYVCFGGPWNGKYSYILCAFGLFIQRPLGKFYAHSAYFLVLVCYTKKNLAVLIHNASPVLKGSDSFSHFYSIGTWADGGATSAATRQTSLRWSWMPDCLQLTNSTSHQEIGFILNRLVNTEWWKIEELRSICACHLIFRVYRKESPFTNVANSIFSDKKTTTVKLFVLIEA